MNFSNTRATLLYLLCALASYVGFRFSGENLTVRTVTSGLFLVFIVLVVVAVVIKVSKSFDKSPVPGSLITKLTSLPFSQKEERLGLPIPYPTAFQLTIVIDALIFLGVLAQMRHVGTKNRSYGFWRGISIFLGILLAGLVISYIAQATFMGWI